MSPQAWLPLSGPQSSRPREASVQIMLGGGGAIHLLVHGGHDGNRRRRGETDRRNQIVGHTGRDAGD
jgi:hypothetical protein